MKAGGKKDYTAPFHSVPPAEIAETLALGAIIEVMARTRLR